MVHQPDEVDLSRRALLAAIPATAATIALASCSSGGSGSKTTGTSTSTTVPRGSTADSSGAQWPFYGHDLSQTRTNVAETKITPTSVAKLTKAWEIDDIIGVTGTPAIVDDVVYFTDWKGQVWAVEASTGKKIWTTPVGGMFVAAPAVSDKGVFVAQGAMLARLNRASGKIEWKATTNSHPQAQINASPVIVDDLVLQGTASFENMMTKDIYSFRGSIGAWDAATGKNRWDFFATKADKTSGPGAGIWSTPAVDTKRGLLYVGTGQGLAPPTPHLADSMLAIDYHTGKLKWSRQFTYPDVFSNGHPGGKDADLGASPNLWTSDGRDLVGGCDKGGTFHTLDRDSGEEVWKVQLAPGSPFGGAIGSAAFVDGSLIASSNLGDPDTNAPTDFSRVFNLDPANGKIRWATDKLDGKIFGPVSAVRGVAFVGTDKGHLFAFDVKTGTELWKADAPDKTACGPAIVDGRVVWGYGFIMFGGPGKGGVITFETGK